LSFDFFRFGEGSLDFLTTSLINSPYRSGDPR
jgi:hypothetical protein